MNQNISKPKTEEEIYDGLVNIIINYATKNKMTLGQISECTDIVEDFFIENAYLKDASDNQENSTRLFFAENEALGIIGKIVIDLSDGELKANNLKSGELNTKKGSE